MFPKMNWKKQHVLSDKTIIEEFQNFRTCCNYFRLIHKSTTQLIYKQYLKIYFYIARTTKIVCGDLWSKTKHAKNKKTKNEKHTRYSFCSTFPSSESFLISSSTGRFCSLDTGVLSSAILIFPMGATQTLATSLVKPRLLGACGRQVWTLITWKTKSSN